MALTRTQVRDALWDRLEQVIGPVPAQGFEEALYWRNHFISMITPGVMRGHGLQLIRTEDSPEGKPQWMVCMLPPPPPKHESPPS